MNDNRKQHSRLALVGVAVMLAGADVTFAQRGAAVERSAREQAEDHFDLTGYWVPIVTDDWLLRMVTPPIGYVGRYEQLPFNEAGATVTPAFGVECSP